MDADEKDILDKRTDKTKVQGTDKTIERKKRPLKENTLLNNPNLSMGEKEKAVKKQATEEIKKVFKGMPDLRKMIDMSTKFETQKILREQEKFQGNKTFLEMISGMKLSPGTISNRAEMSDKGVYDNFKDYLERGKKERPKSEKEFRTGNTFIIGREEEKEHFKILGIKETDSGMKAVILGNEKTKDVEIVFEGTNPGLTDIQKNPKEWSRDWSNKPEQNKGESDWNYNSFFCIWHTWSRREDELSASSKSRSI